MTSSDIGSSEEFKVKILSPAPVWRQLLALLKITFLQRFRSQMLILEVVLPIVFLVFICLFASRVDPLTDPNPTPTPHPIIPFAAIGGISPNYGMIPDSAESHRFLDVLNEKSIMPMKQNATFFNTFDEYKNFIFANRKVDERFYATEWTSSNNNNDNNIRISSNGMTLGSLPYLIQDLGETILNISHNANTVISLQYKMFPHKPKIQYDFKNALYVTIFSTVQPISGVLSTGIYYGAEAESGLRDLFTFLGVGFFINELRWYLISFIMLFITSIPFAIAVSAAIGINFGLSILFYILSSTAYSSFLLFLMSLWPTKAMGNLAGYGMLLTFFVIVFWGYFDWLYKESGYAEKYVLSIFPHAALSFTMAQMASGEVTTFSEMDRSLYYPVRNGFIYLTVESIVYFGLYILIESLKRRKWLPAPISWKNATSFSNESSPISVKKVKKTYGKTVAIDDISFEVNEGEKLAIVGPNGAGKSTLMSILSGTIVPDHGQIKFRGIEILKNIKTIHQIVGYCPQDNLFMNELTAKEWITAVCELRNEPHFDYSEIFETLGLDQQLNYRIGKMSGGNKRKVCLASALACHPSIVVLDEATSGVDFTSRTRIWSIISGLKNTTVIMATHTLEECEKIADRIMVLSEGEISELAPPNDLRQIFKCGYQIETSKENIEELESIAREAGLDPSFDEDDDKVRLYVPSDEADSLSHLLHHMDFKYILSIQSLEEQIFNHIHKHEFEKITQEQKMANQTDDIEPLYLSDTEDKPPV